MRLVTYACADAPLRLGALVDEWVIDLNRAYRLMLEGKGAGRAQERANALVPPEPVAFLEGGEDSLAAAREAVAFATENPERAQQAGAAVRREAVRLGPPVLRPGKIVCVGHNYREHILEMKRELPEYPVIFAKFANTLIGPFDDIPLLPITHQLDYEAELAFVIGKRAKNVPREEAMAYVAGFAVANDVTARDLQRRTVQWLQGKTLDGSLPLGPCLVTREELPDPHNLDISLSVNGELRQRANTRSLVFTVDDLVSFLSEIMTLEPGDVVLTGTPGGVGVAMDPPTFLKDGDRVRVEIAGIGALENRVRAVDRWGVPLHREGEVEAERSERL
ncbi:MAG TPA: fumarylacetoacetate hydrolase family protein [Calditerricola sp.]